MVEVGVRVSSHLKEELAWAVIVIVIVIAIFNQGVHSVKLIFSGALDKHTI